MSDELRILMVEDVSTDAELEVRELRRAGLRVAHTIVETESAFREALRDFRPGLIISDFSMPHFDGMWALALARELVPDVPFIFVSGTIGEEYAIRALKNGAADYVLKNNLVRLPAAVERVLHDYAERAARQIAEARLRATFDNVPIGIMHTDLDTDRILLANPKLVELLGYTQDELLGMKMDDILHPDHRATGRGKYRERILKGELNSFASERQFVRKDGSAFWVNRTMSLVRDAAGKPLYFIRMVEDITERKSQELKIARLSRIHAVLSGINSTIVRVRDRQELHDEACRIAVEHGKFGIACIGMLDQKTLDVVPVACAGVEAGSLIALSRSTARADSARGSGFVARAIREKRVTFSNDISQEGTRGGERRKEALRRGYRSLIVLPLLVDGTPVGILSLFAKEPNFFDDEEIKLLSELAGDISFALAHIAREEKLAKISRIRMVSSEINAAIVRIHEREALLRETCRITAEHGKFELVWAALLDEEKKEVNPVAWTGFSREAAHAVTWATIGSAQGTLGEAIQTRKASVRRDIEEQYVRGKLREEALNRGCRSTVCLPVVADDHVVALIALFATGLDFFDEDELALLNEVAGNISFALENINKEARLNYLAYYDVLTGLPNRTLFNERLSRQLHVALEKGTRVAVLLGDVQRFRNINESLGQHAGDTLLRELAARARKVWPDPDNVARIAANCFAGIVADLKDETEIAHVAGHFTAEVLGPSFMIENKELAIAMSVGIAVFPTDGKDADTLFRNGEAALKRAKASGERYLFYRPEMNARVAETLQLENKMRQALDREEFVLHYQPKLDLAKATISGLEALIRWNDPATGLVPPVKFIPLLEETGMILEAGGWAMRKAVAEYRAWHEQGLQPPRIAVNVSPIQLRQKDFVEVVRDVIAGAGGGSHGLDLEITESLLMEDIEGNIEKLRTIRDMGVNIAIDDFGTGYSSLSYLAKLPVNAIKIDRSFIITMVSDADSMSIVSTIISLAHTLNLKVIAEGVDSEEQSRFLRLLKCDEIQGYLISKPVPASDVEVLLATRRSGS